MKPLVVVRCGLTLRRASVLGACVAFGVLAAGCAGSQALSAAGTVIQVNERDFAISAPRHVAAGTVTLRVKNQGPDAHELIVVRSRNGRLPFRGDDLTVDEDAVERATLGALEPGAPGGSRELHLHLRPGRYVLFCNMSGHYLGGMRSVLEVR
jgi:uncharacterized cupredoxin-like copper-binding protein